MIKKTNKTYIVASIWEEKVDQEESVLSTRTEEDQSEPSTGANSGYFVNTCEAASANSSKRYKSVRKYESHYIKFGFIWSGRSMS